MKFSQRFKFWTVELEHRVRDNFYNATVTFNDEFKGRTLVERILQPHNVDDFLNVNHADPRGVSAEYIY